MARDLNIQSKIVDTDQYVYRKERDIEKTQVNWAEIAKDVTGTVEKIRDDRQEQKNELAQIQRDTMNTLADYDQYDAEALNKTIIGGAHNASNYLVMLNDQMRSGEISPTDYMMGAQQITDNFAQLKTATKNWDTHYKEAMARLELNAQGDPSANFAEQAMNLEMSSFGNLSQLTLYVNPLTGTMSFIKKGADVNDPTNHQSLSSINARMQQKSDFININTLQDKQVEGLAKIAQVNTDFARDATMTLEDFRKLEYTDPDGQVKKYDDLLQSYINQNLATDDMKLSTLQQFAQYDSDDITYSEEEFKKDPMKVLVRPDKSGSGRMEFVFSDELEEKMRQLQMENLETKLDSIYKFDKGYTPRQRDPDRPSDSETFGQAWGYIDKISDAFSGDQVTKDEAVTYLRGEMPPHPEFGKFRDIDSDSSKDYWYIVMDNKRIPVSKYELNTDGSRKLDENNRPIQSDFRNVVEQAFPYILGGRKMDKMPIDQAVDTYIKNYGEDAFTYKGDWGKELKGTQFYEIEGEVDENAYYQNPAGDVVQAQQLFKEASEEDSESKRGDAYVGATNSYATKNLPNNEVSVRWKDEKGLLSGDAFTDKNTIILTVDGTEYPKKFNLKRGSNEYYQWLEETVNKIRAENDRKTKQGMRGGDDKNYGDDSGNTDNQGT